MGEQGRMEDDNERKVVKKKVVKKVKRPTGEGDARPAGNDDALAAFGINETKEVSKAKLVTPVAKPTAPPQTTPGTEGGPKKVVAKKVVKKVRRPDGETPTQGVAKPAVAPPKAPVDDNDIEVEPIEDGSEEPGLAITVTAPTTLEKVPPTAPTVLGTDDGKKPGGLRELLSARKPPEAKPATTEGSSTLDEDFADLDQANELLEDIDLDKITKNIQEDLLETFEEKIDDILVDIIEDENTVEELTRGDSDKGTKQNDDLDDKDLDKLLEDSEKGPSGPQTLPPPKPALTKPEPTPAVTKPATTVTPSKPLGTKPIPTKTEVPTRPEVKLDADVELPKKDVVSDDPVTMEKTDIKVIADDTASPKKNDIKAVTKDVGPGDDAIRIEEGDVRERRVAYKVAHNFDKLPPNMRNELLRNLAKVGDPKVREDVVVAIATHFKTLPADIQGLMTNLARDDNSHVREEVVFEIQSNFTNISTTIRERILKALVMDKEPSVREEVVSTICQHYNDLSPDVRELLKTLAKDKVRSVREELSFEMQKSDSPIPKDVRDEVLGMVKGQR